MAGDISCHVEDRPDVASVRCAWRRQRVVQKLPRVK